MVPILMIFFLLFYYFPMKSYICECRNWDKLVNFTAKFEENFLTPEGKNNRMIFPRSTNRYGPIEFDKWLFNLKVVGMYPGIWSTSKLLTCIRGGGGLWMWTHVTQNLIVTAVTTQIRRAINGTRHTTWSTESDQYMAIVIGRVWESVNGEW